MKRCKWILMIATFLVVMDERGFAQEHDAPAPSQLATATTAFLGVGGVPPVSGDESESVRIAYNSLYRSLLANGHYKLMTKPEEAELALELSISVGGHETLPGFTMRIIDIRTHITLWTIAEPVLAAARVKTYYKNVDAATAKLVTDLNAFSVGRPARE